MLSIDIIADVLGYIGSGLIVLAYLLLQSERITSDMYRYPLLNLVGATLLLISLLVHTNLPSLVIEVFWIAISIYGAWMIYRKRQK